MLKSFNFFVRSRELFKKRDIFDVPFFDKRPANGVEMVELLRIFLRPDHPLLESLLAFNKLFEELLLKLVRIERHDDGRFNPAVLGKPVAVQIEPDDFGQKSAHVVSQGNLVLDFNQFWSLYELAHCRLDGGCCVGFDFGEKESTELFAVDLRHDWIS